MIRLGVWNEKRCLMKFLTTHEGRIKVAAIAPVVNIDDPTAEDPDRIYMMYELTPPTAPIEAPQKPENILVSVAGHTILRGGK